MPWIEYHIEITSEHSEMLSEELTEMGAQAITFQDAGDHPIYEPAFDKVPPIWKETTLIALFDSEDDATPLIQFLEKQQSLHTLKNFTTKHIADEDWERRCLADFKPISFGKRLWIVPSWEKAPDPNGTNIILDPGLAFGTGTHPTTALCLEWLDANFQQGTSVIDYGCGSGILSLAAAKLGAKHISAVDHDPQALFSTTENALRNDIPEGLISTYLPQDFPTQTADLLLANILTQPLIGLAENFSNFLVPRGKCVLSGILVDQIDLIIDVYRLYFELEVPVFKQDWVRIVGVKK